MAALLGRLAGRIAARPRRALAVLLVALAAVGGLAAAFGGEYADDFSTPGTDSQRASDLLDERFPAAAGDGATVVFATDAGRLTGGAPADGIRATVAAIRRQPGVVSVAPPEVARDGRTAFSEVQYAAAAPDLDEATLERLEDAGTPARAAGLEVSLRGVVVDELAAGESHLSELLGVAVALVVLLLVFRSGAAMAVTLGSAFVALGVGLGLLLLGTALIDLPTLAPTLAVMLGLGAGIDYALLLVARHRANLADGDTPAAALRKANATAGTSVLAAGAIVIVAIAGLTLTGIPFVGRMGIGAAIAVGAVAVGAVTVLPTLLALLGERMRPRDPAAAGPSPAFAAWAGRIARRPWPAAIAALALLLVLASPVTGLRLGTPDDGNRPADATQRVAYDRLTEGFGPGANGPLLLAAALPSDRAGARTALTRLERESRADPGVAAVTPARASPRGDAAVLTVVPRTSPQDAATSDLVERLREEVLPTAVAGTGVRVHLGGATAVNEDLSTKVSGRLPIFIAAVIGLSVLLLTVVFRSILVPLVSAAFNLLSVVAAYGVVVAVFQDGVGAGLLGVDGEVPIVSFIPLFMFALLFGLSMDYNVFLQSRIHEEHRAGRGAQEAVRRGVAATGRVISGAGAIMVAVFGAFVIGDDVTTKMIGLGLAAAILIDVVLVRFLLAPAVMHLLGERAWRFPAWLDRRLPRIALEGSP